MSYDDYADYYDVYGPSGMADDRYDSEDSEYRDLDGYCGHGSYVGGCGIDYMCQWCEDGVSVAEMNEILSWERTREVRKIAARAERLLAVLLRYGYPGIAACDFVERDLSGYTRNPAGRYGRH